jgi:hypothetical protein
VKLIIKWVKKTANRRNIPSLKSRCTELKNIFDYFTIFATYLKPQASSQSNPTNRNTLLNPNTKKEQIQVQVQKRCSFFGIKIFIYLNHDLFWKKKIFCVNFTQIMSGIAHRIFVNFT